MKNDGNKIQEERWGYATSLQVAEEQIITQWKLPPKAILEQCIDGEILHTTYLFPDIILDIVFEIPPVLQDHASKNCSNRFQYLGAPTMSSSARSNLDATWWLQTGRFWAVNFSNILLGWNPTLISWILGEPVSCCFMVQKFDPAQRSVENTNQHC